MPSTPQILIGILGVALILVAFLDEGFELFGVKIGRIGGTITRRVLAFVAGVCFLTVAYVDPMSRMVALSQTSYTPTPQSAAVLPTDSTSPTSVPPITEIPTTTFVPSATPTVAPEPTLLQPTQPPSTIEPSSTMPPATAAIAASPTPTLTSEITPTPDIPVLKLGETYTNERGLAITLQSYGIGEYGVGLSIKFANTSDKDILVRYQQSQLEVSDDTGQVYSSPGHNNPKQISLAPGASVTIASDGNEFRTDPPTVIGTFLGVASDRAKYLYLTMYQFMGTPKIRWEIADLDPTEQAQSPSPGTIVKAGESFTGGGLSVKLVDVGVSSNSIYVKFTVRNVSDKPILVRYHLNNIEVVDDNGGSYPNDGRSEYKQYHLASGDSVDIVSVDNPFTTNPFGRIGKFNGVIGPTATTLTIRISQFMQMRDLVWVKEI